MTSYYDDFQKTGLDKMLKIAKVLCRLVQTFRVIIDAKFPDSVPIQALMTAISLLCPLIADADAEFRAYQTDSTLPPADALETVGIDPDAPDAIDPDFEI